MKSKEWCVCRQTMCNGFPLFRLTRHKTQRKNLCFTMCRAKPTYPVSIITKGVHFIFYQSQTIGYYYYQNNENMSGRIKNFVLILKENFKPSSIKPSPMPIPSCHKKFQFTFLAFGLSLKRGHFTLHFM